jgi:choline dehydrogenase-like flavoprotein
MRDDEGMTRREFAKQAAATTMLLAGLASGVNEASAALSGSDPAHAVVTRLGSLFIPSRPGDPGYKDLESYGITDFVLQKFSGDTTEVFNNAAKQFFDGKSFLELDEKQAEDYLRLILEGSKITDPQQRLPLQAFYRSARTRILNVYYQNFPENQVKRNAEGDPILKPGDTHQETNPNTSKIVTGWDIAGYKSQPDWKEEEQLRETAKKTLPYWYEGDTVTLTGRMPPSPATKTASGADYYDVVVVGGGTAGCMIAGRLAERGVNPKTGDRLRVAMIEGGRDWTIRDPGLKPGYGNPVRRRQITSIPDGIGPEGRIPGPAYRHNAWVPLENDFQLIGGCSNHYGGTIWIPGEEDFRLYREASGVDWDLSKFGGAIEEVREMYYVMSPPDAWWCARDHVWADAGRSLGFEMRAPEIAYRNPLGIEKTGAYMSRYDTKGTSLPWAYIGLNNGLKVIAEAEVEKILIEKSAGGRPVATGVVYRRKGENGSSKEVRAARVIVASGVFGTPLLLYKSGYGPRDILGDNLLVENKNVGRNLSGDFEIIARAFLAEPVVPGDHNLEMHSPEPWTSIQPRPWGELTVHIREDHVRSGGPEEEALGVFAPDFGWEHKEFMRNGFGARHILAWQVKFGAVPWSWRVLPPDGRIERVEMDAPRIEATIRQAKDVMQAWFGKLSVKPVKTDMRAFSVPVSAREPQHICGTARAGASPETSVCSPDFDCHDIDNLIISSAAAVPRTFFWALGPTAVNAAYGWRRILANHFSRGCSTKGFA